MNEVWSPAFLFELNAREVIDNVPQLSRIFLGRLNYVQQRQSKTCLQRVRNVLSFEADGRHWRAPGHGLELATLGPVRDPDRSPMAAAPH